VELDHPATVNVAQTRRREAAHHPVVAYLAVVVIGFALLAAAAIALGWALETYVLPDHGVGHADEHVNVWLSQHRTPTRNDVSTWLSGLGDIYAIPALVAITAIVAAIRRNWRVVGFILAAIGVEAATYRITTFVIHRQRPAVPRLEQLPVNASYFSGHTAASVAVYCGIALVLTRAIARRWFSLTCWTVAIVIPLLVGFARMYRGMHHPTDVAAGVLVGIGSLLVASAASRAGARTAAASPERVG
jgi:membrane-associated phospholipid phosphatase